LPDAAGPSMAITIFCKVLYQDFKYT